MIQKITTTEEIPARSSRIHREQKVSFSCNGLGTLNTVRTQFVARDCS
jgi:hypothetical protein